MSSNEVTDEVLIERKHFKIGSRKSKLAMVQSEFIMSEMKKLNPDYTFEIINFDTKGDTILNVALPKIGDKGLFTKELEDALENGRIDFVVHSLKDMPCQTLPDNLIIAGVPEREDPRDALVVSKRLQGVKQCLDDLEPNSVIGTSSLRRICQLKHKYPNFIFETIRGNLQTRFAKLDDEVDKKFDAIILAAAGLKRMGYEDRITQILPNDVCMHAVSQGALGIECRRDDLTVIRMLNRLNHEDSLLKCVAERTFLAKLEGGCSAPVGVKSEITEHSIILEGIVLDLDGKQIFQDSFEMRFEGSLTNDNCPILSSFKEAEKKILLNLTKNPIDGSGDGATEPLVSNQTKNLKHKLDDSESDDVINTKRVKLNESSHVQSNATNIPIDTNNIIKHFSFITDLNIKENKLMKAELCGLHLAEKLKERGADLLIRDIKLQVLKS